MDSPRPEPPAPRIAFQASPPKLPPFEAPPSGPLPASRTFKRYRVPDTAPRSFKRRPVLQDVPRRRYTARDILTLVWHARPIWAAALAAGAVIGGVVGLALPGDYTASVLLSVPATDDASMQTGRPIAQGSEPVSSDLVRGIVDRVGPQRLLAALQAPGPLDRLWPLCPPAPDGSILGCARAVAAARFQASIEGPNRLLRFTVWHPDAAVATAMLNAAIATDADLRSQNAATQTAQRASEIEPQLAAAQRDVADTLAQQAAIRREADVLDITQDMAVTSAAAGALAQRQREVAQRRAAIEAKLAHPAADTSSADAPAPDGRAADGRAADRQPDMRAKLLQLQLDRAHLAALYKPGYPGIAELDRKIDIVRQALHDDGAASAPPLPSRVSALQAERAAVGREAEELARQAGPIAARIAVLRDANTKLAVLRERQAAQEAVVTRLSVALADARAQDALNAPRRQDPQVVQRPLPTRTSHAGLGLAAAAFAGLLGGLGATWIAGRRRPTYIVAREAERHLGLEQLAAIDLDRRADLPAAIRALAAKLLAATDAPGLAGSTIHLVGTADADGAELIASRLADELVAAGGLRVLLFVHRSEDHADIRSLGPGPQAEAWSGVRRLAPEARRGIVSRGATVSPEWPAATVARGLLGDRDMPASLSPLRLARLRATHDLILTASAHGVAAPVAQELSALADLSLLVICAQRSSAEAAARLCDGLAAAGGRILGFAFTTSRSRSWSEAA